MLRRVSHFAILFLFLLSLLTWIYVPLLLAWELSLVTTQLGHWLALATCVFSIPLRFPNLHLRHRDRLIDFGFSLAALAALVTYLTPLALASHKFPGEISWPTLFQLRTEETPHKRTTFTAANDQTPLNLDFYPAPQPSSPSVLSPWVLVIHGGGWINGSSDQLPELNWYLNQKGYAVISVDYRLSPGWLWPAPRDDIFRALKFIRAHATEWKIDPDQWAILGRSAGAQIAGVVAYSLHGSSKPKGFISFYGPSDLVFGYNLGQEDDILKSRTLLRGFLGGTPSEVTELYKSGSEMGAITSDACPTLLIHGEQDTIVSYKHSVRLLATLKSFAIDVKFVSLHFGPHGFDYFFTGPEGQVSTFEVDRFLKRVLPVNGERVSDSPKEKHALQ